MIKIILIFMLSSLSLQAEWKEAFFKQSYVPISIDCVDSNNCYALINSISAKDNEETLIYKSYNQGRDWKEIYRYNPLVDNPKFLFSPWCASVPNGKDYFISYFERGTLKVSNDSAKTFRIVDLETPREVLWMDMYDDKIGMAFTPINNYITYDGWETWEKRDDFFKISDTLNKVIEARAPQFLNKDTLFLLSGRSNWASSFNVYNINTKKSSFDIIDTNYYERPVFIQDFCFIDINTLIAVGSRSSTFGQNSYNLIYKSTNNGKSWIKKHEQLEGLPIGYAGGLQKVSFYNKNNGIAVGARGSILLTNDGGETWVYNDITASMEDSPKMKIEWAGRTPIIGAYKGGLYYYEGDFFKFEEEPNLYKLSGRVVTEDGEGVPNVPLVLTIYIPFEFTLEKIYTDENGYYEYLKLQESKVILELPKPNYQRRYVPDYSNIELKGDSTFNIIMEKPKNYYSVSGQAFDEDESIPGFFVEIQTDFGDTIIQANMQGQFYIEKIPESNISITHPYGFTSTFIGNQIRPSWHRFKLMNDTTDLIFKINERIKSSIFFVTGTVTLNGQGLPNVKINENFYNIDIYTNEEGRYITPYYNLWLSPRISIDSVINGVTYNVTPKEYEIDFIEISDDAINIDFELSPITSVETKDNTSFIYPNPANETVTISGIDFGRVEIYNSLGQMLIQSEIHGNSTINTSKLQTGIYILKIESNSQVKFEKLLINK